MSYVDGFVIAVPTANKQKFIDHAAEGDSMFMEMGALRVLECWGEEVPDGEKTDFRRAVKAKKDESVVFSWRRCRSETRMADCNQNEHVV